MRQTWALWNGEFQLGGQREQGTGRERGGGDDDSNTRKRGKGGRRDGTGGRRAGTRRKIGRGVCVSSVIITGGARGIDERGDRTAGERQNGQEEKMCCGEEGSERTPSSAILPRYSARTERPTACVRWTTGGRVCIIRWPTADFIQKGRRGRHLQLIRPVLTSFPKPKPRFYKRDKNLVFGFGKEVRTGLMSCKCLPLLPF
jgi:hypothetical protein